MSEQVIPEVRVTICDRCGARSDAARDPFYYHHASVRVTETSRGYDGGSGSGARVLDLCGKCTESLAAWLKRDALEASALRQRVAELEAALRGVQAFADKLDAHEMTGAGIVAKAIAADIRAAMGGSDLAGLNRHEMG